MQIKAYIVIRKSKTPAYWRNDKIESVWITMIDAENERDRLKNRHPTKDYIVNYYIMN